MVLDRDAAEHQLGDETRRITPAKTVTEDDMNLPPLPEPHDYTHWEGRIKSLMGQVGMPESQSLAIAFKQLVNEMTQAQREAVSAAVPEQLAIDKIKVLADEYASRCSEFARSLALGKPDDSMSPVSSAAGDARMALHNAIGCAFRHQSPADRVAAAVPEGWKLVPIDPTPEMCRAFFLAEPSGNLDPGQEARIFYQAMLEASPEVKP